MSSKKLIQKGIMFIHLNEESPHQTGVAHGQLLKQEITKLIVDLETFARNHYPLFFGQLFLEFLKFRAGALMNNFPPKQQEEMRGIAKGCDQNIKWVLLANTIHDVIAPYRKVVLACSAFISQWQNTNQTVIAKTTDLYIIKELAALLAKNKIAFIHRSPWHQQKLLTLAFPGCLAGDTLVFENNTCLVVNDGGSLDKKIFLKNLPLISIVKTIANQGLEIKSSLKTLKKTKPIKAYTLLITGGKTHNSFLIDLAPENYQIHRFSQPLINTNRFRSKKMRQENYQKNYQTNLRFTNTRIRYQKLAEKIQIISSLKNVIEALQIHSPDFNHHLGSIANKGTVQGLIFLPSKRKILLPAGKKIPVTWFGQWQEFRLEEIFT